MQSIANTIVSVIRGHGRGWVFTPKDFAGCGGRKAIDITISRLLKKGTIRQLLRGVYHYPRFSTLFNAPASPEPDHIAQAIARNHGWSIFPSGETAMNVLGLSAQVPGKYIYVSDGPSKKYVWSGGELHFTRRAIKETAALSARTALVVRALKALGKEQVDTTIIHKLAQKLTAKEKAAALREARYVTGWVYEVLAEIAKEEDTHG